MRFFLHWRTYTDAFSLLSSHILFPTLFRTNALFPLVTHINALFWRTNYTDALSLLSSHVLLPTAPVDSLHRQSRTLLGGQGGHESPPPGYAPVYPVRYVRGAP